MRIAAAVALVSIHAPLRGATLAGRSREPIKESFNPRAPAGRDQCGGGVQAWFEKFQSTRPCGARLYIIEGAQKPKLFQSTRPCGARQELRLPYPAHGGVSIHAPLRGATSLVEVHALDLSVSIHAPLRGATLFSSRPEPFDTVSIHAPLRGATPT